MDLKKGKHRFVMLNACQNRFLNLHFETEQGKTLPVQMVRVDMTYYDKQVIVTEFMATMASRIEFILDLSNVKGSVFLKNDAEAPYPDGDDDNLVPEFTGQIFRIDVQTKLLQSVNEEGIKEHKVKIADDIQEEDLEQKETLQAARYPLFD
jgi:FtsP/CotA-like multicopper oxidase with cupredoxin domain